MCKKPCHCVNFGMVFALISIELKIKNTMLGVISMIVMVMTTVFSIILLLVLPTEPIGIILYVVGNVCGIIVFIISLFIDDDYDYNYNHNYGYDDGKKETKNEEKKPFIVKLKTTCTHCGAPMKGDTCEFCGCKSEIYKVIQ